MQKLHIPISRQIECVEREIKLRRRVYPRRIAEEKMSQQFAQEELDVMAAVLLTLQNIEAGQRLI